MKFLIVISFLILGMAMQAKAKIHTESVGYKDGNSPLEGYLAYDDSIQGVRPGIIVVHEYWGLVDYTKMRTEQLAKLGYISFAIDMYGKGVLPKNSDEAAAQSKIYYSDRQLMRRRALAGLEEFKKNKLVDPNKIVAIGYCFGGGVALEMGRAGYPIVGIVSFHGNLSNPNPDDAKNIRGKVLACAGGSDPFVNRQAREAFEDEMTKAGVDWRMNVYGDAVHAFTNPAAGNDPSKGAAYNEKADKRSWQAMLDFFNEVFK